jgi:hypothetical protein
MRVQSRRRWQLRASFLAFLLVVAPLFPIATARAQGPNASAIEVSDIDPTLPLSQILRLERIEVPGGAELITVHDKLSGL